MEQYRKILSKAISEVEPPFQLGRLCVKTQIPGRIARTESAGRPYPLSGTLELLGAFMPFPRDAGIYREDQPAEYLYKVISGTVRSSKALSDGRRKIGAFYMRGDFFGLETGRHTFSADAITDVKVVAIKRSAVVALAARDVDVARLLWAVTSYELEHVQSHILLLVESAERRVASFLLEMADRIPTSNDIELPMSRQDIADYLGLTIETVSRVLTHLEKVAVIARPTSRRVVLHSRSALQQLIAGARTQARRKTLAARR